MSPYVRHQITVRLLTERLVEEFLKGPQKVIVVFLRTEKLLKRSTIFCFSSVRPATFRWTIRG